MLKKKRNWLHHFNVFLSSVSYLILEILDEANIIKNNFLVMIMIIFQIILLIYSGRGKTLCWTVSISVCVTPCRTSKTKKLNASCLPGCVWYVCFDPPVITSSVQKLNIEDSLCQHHNFGHGELRHKMASMVVWLREQSRLCTAVRNMQCV